MAYENITLKYATVELFADMLGFKNKVPSWDVGEIPVNEVIGTGDDSKTQFFLDQKSIIANTYTLYADTTLMIDVTDYSIDLDTGEITLTSAGVTKLGVKSLNGKYSYLNNNMLNSYLTGVLIRAEKEVDDSTNCVFTDGSADNPDYPSKTEIQQSEGIFMDRVIVEKKPLVDVSSSIDGDITDSDGTISLATGTGVNFPSSGTIIIGSEAITYGAVSTDDLIGCTRGVLGTTAAAHISEDAVHTTLLFRSDTAEGSSVAWTIQPWNTSMFTDESGLIYKFSKASPDPLLRVGVANRTKIIYLYGYNTIPKSIERLTLLFAKRMLIQDNIGKSMIAGRDEFQPEMFNADLEEINKIINPYIILPMGNT